MNDTVNEQRTSGAINVGPLSVVMRMGTLFVSVNRQLPTTSPWPVEFELEVCEALDEFLDVNANLSIETVGWNPSKRQCPLVWWKLEIMRVFVAKLRGEGVLPFPAG